MAANNKPTWQRAIQRHRSKWNANMGKTRPPGVLADVFRAAQSGVLAERIVWLFPYGGSFGTKPEFALIPLSDLRWLESGAGAPEALPTVARPLALADSIQRPAAPDDITARDNLKAAWELARSGKCRVELTLQGKPIAAVVLLDDLALLEEAAAAAPPEAAAGGA